MKNLFKSMMLVAVAAMGFTACVNENMDDVAPEMGQNMVTMTITADNADATRTLITEENGNAVNFGWNNEGEVLRVIEVADESSSTAATTEYALTDGKASFTVSFAENTEAEAFTYYAVYPEANYVSSDNKNLDKFKVALPEAQTYVAGSFDANADLMIAKPYATTEQPTALSMQFTRLVAIAKMTLKGMPEDKNITALTFTAASKALAGRAYVSLNTGVVEEYGYTGQSKDAIALTIDEGAAINNDAVYFTCFPFELVAGDTFEVKAVTADKYTYTKTVTLNESQSLAFTAGNMSAFTVNMESANVAAPGKVFTLLTDVSKLHIGDEIIIANTTNSVALSTTQNKNNRGQQTVDIEDNTITAVDGVAVLTVGKDGDFYTLYDPANSGYLYAVSGNNYLRTQATNTDAGLWTISIDNGETTIEVTDLSREMRQNSSNSIFSCYAIGNQNAVSIFLNDINDSDPVIPTITAETAVALTSEESEGTVTITTQDVEGEVTATLGAEYDWFLAELDEDGNLYYIASANDTDAIRTATVTLSAEGATDVVITFTQSAPAAVVAKSTVEDFITTADTETYYELTGVVSNVANTTYGNFDLTDATGTIYVYGLYSPDGQTNKYWSTSGVKAGDVITVQGQYTYFNDTTHEVVNARYISHYGFTATAASTSIAAAGGSTTITLAPTGTLPEAITFTKEGDATVSLIGNTATVTYGENGEEARSTTITFTSGLATQIVTINQAATSTGGESATYTESFSGITTQKTGYITVLSYTSTDVQIGGSYIVWSGSCAQYVGNSGKAAVAFGKGTGSYIQTTVADGLTSLTINYILPFKDTQVNFVLNVNGEDVETKNVTGLSGAGATGSVEFTGLNYSGETIIKIHQGSVQTRSGIASIVWTNNN